MSPDPRESRIAQCLADRYELIEPLGKGGFAVVYKVRNRRLQRVEALKVLSERLTGQPDFAKRFEQEARVAASLDHPNIVKIYDYGAVEEIFWFSMQFIGGPSVAKQLKQRKRLEPLAVARIASGVLSALAYSHARSVIHRDIKPDNILLDAENRPYLTDFGVAKSEVSLVQTHVGTLLGSPAFMAPEQIEAKPLDGRSDLYSLGVSLYKMLTGELPFSADDSLSGAMKRLTEPPKKLSEKRPDISPKLEAIVMRALARRPEDRFPSAREMLDGIDGFLAANRPTSSSRAAGQASWHTAADAPAGQRGPDARSAQRAAGATAARDPDATTAISRLAVHPPSGSGAAPTRLPPFPSLRHRWAIPSAALALALGILFLLWRPWAEKSRGRTWVPVSPPDAPTATGPRATAAPPPAAPEAAPAAPPARPIPSSPPPEPRAERVPSPRASRSPAPIVPRPIAVEPTPLQTREEPRPPTPIPISRVPKFRPEVEQKASVLLAQEIASAHKDESVGLMVVVAEDGTVKSAKVISEVCPECDRAALEAVRHYRFRPARDNDGKPLEATVAISIRF